MSRGVKNGGKKWKDEDFMDQGQVCWKQTKAFYGDLNQLEASDSEEALRDDGDVRREK